MPYQPPSAGMVQPVGHKVGLTGVGSAFYAPGLWAITRIAHVMPAATGGASDIQVVLGNFSGGAYPEPNTNPITCGEAIEYGGNAYLASFSAGQPGANPFSVVIPGGGTILSDPLPLFIPPGATYFSRTLVAVTSGQQYPASRNTQPQLGEMVMYGSGTAPQTALGADLVTSAATAAGGATLTFTSTALSGFGGAALAVGAQLIGQNLLPGTKVTAFSATTLTISPPAIGAVASGATIHVYANRGFDNVGGFGPLNILGRVRQPCASALIYGDSIAAGRYVTGTLTTTAAASANVLTFASTTMSTAVMFPGIEVPAWNNPGVPANTVVGVVTPTLVTLVNATTGAAATLTGAALNSGTTFTFGQNCDPIGNAGYVERGLVKGFGTTALAPAIPWCNMAVSGDNLYNFWSNLNGQCRMKPLSHGFTHVVDEYGINDFSSGTYASFAAFQAAKLALWTLWASYGLRVVACTILAETTSTDGWATAANQTAANANFAAGGIEQQYNDWIRTLPAPLWGVLDAADAQMTARDSQLWTTASLSNGGTATPYPMTVDGVHPTGAGVPVLAAKVAAAVGTGMFT